jgi:hypothetical protein
MKAAGSQSLSATAMPSTLSGSGASSFSSTSLGPRHASIAHLSPPKLQPQAPGSRPFALAFAIVISTDTFCPGPLQPLRVAAVPFSASARRTTSDSSFSSGATDSQRHSFDPSQLLRPASSSQLRALQVALPDSRAKLLWAKVRSKVVRGSDFTELLRTLRALHNISLTFVNSYDGFTAPSKAIDFICRHSLTPSFAPFWLDAHCLSEDEARRIQRAFGFHSKTYSLLFSHSHGHNSLKYEREVRARHSPHDLPFLWSSAAPSLVFRLARGSCAAAASEAQPRPTSPSTSTCRVPSRPTSASLTCRSSSCAVATA